VRHKVEYESEGEVEGDEKIGKEYK